MGAQDTRQAQLQASTADEAVTQLLMRLHAVRRLVALCEDWPLFII